MLLERLGARQFRALARGSGCARQPLRVSCRNGIPALATSSLSDPSNHRVVGIRQHSITPQLTPIAIRISRPKFSQEASAIRSLRSAPTLEAWSDRLRALDDRILVSPGFWDEAFGIAQTKLQGPGIQATLKALLDSGHGPSRKLSLYRSRHFSSLLLEVSSIAYAQPTATQTTRTVPTSNELSYWKDLGSYITLEASKFGRKPPTQYRVYIRILHRMLSIAPDQLGTFHNLLSSPLEPSKEDIIALIVESAKSQRKQEALQRFVFTLPVFKDAHDDTVRQLSQRGWFSEALSWQKAFWRHEQGPRDGEVLKPLIEHLYNSKKVQEAKRLEQISSVSSQPHFESIAASIEQRFPQGSIRRSLWTDDKSARIYATRFLSLNAVISSLRMFDVSEIGASSVRELLLRCSDENELDMAALRAHLERLKEEGIRLDDSAMYCRLFRQLLHGDDSVTLHQLTATDIHPSVFDDTNTMNNIFVHLDPVLEPQNWNLMTKALLVDTPEGARASEYWNLRLRRSIARNDDEALHEALHETRSSPVRVTVSTIQVLYETYMAQLGSGATHSSAVIDRLVQLFSAVIGNSSFIPPFYWDDILRTLLISGNLDAHEDLCMKIAIWYSDRKFHNLRDVGQVLDPGKGPVQRGTLFRTQCLVEILMHYMHYGSSETDASLKIFKSDSAKVRARLIASHPMLRGLRLLVRLRERGVKIETAVIQQILRARIALMCRTGYRLSSGVVLHRLDNTLERDYHLAVALLLGTRDPHLKDMKFEPSREDRPHSHAPANAASIHAPDHETELSGDSGNLDGALGRMTMHQ